MTGLLNISAEDAEEYSRSLAQMGEGAALIVDAWHRQISWAQRQGLPEAEGLSIAEWREKYYPNSSYPLATRREAAKELAAEGHSGDEIAEILGTSRATAFRDLSHDETATPNGAGDEQGLMSPEDDSSSQIETESLWPDGESASGYEDECERCGTEYNGGGHCPSCGQLTAVPEPNVSNGDEHLCVFVAGKPCEGCGRPAPPPVVNDGDEWYTPPWLFRSLGIEFSLDVCAPLDRTYSYVPAEQHLTIEDDGLAQHWHGTVWCNPPYSKPEPWARRLIHHGDGLLLTHIPMNAAWATDVWDACDAIRLFQAMEFVRPDGTSQRPGYWLQLAAFGPVATEALGRIQPLGDAAFNKRRVASPMWKQVAE